MMLNRSRIRPQRESRDPPAGERGRRPAHKRQGLQALGALLSVLPGCFALIDAGEQQPFPLYVEEIFPGGLIGSSVRLPPRLLGVAAALSNFVARNQAAAP